MNRLIITVMGYVMKFEAALMLLPLGVCVIYQEWHSAGCFAVTMVIELVLGILLSIKKAERKHMELREGFAAVALIWMVLALFGGLPFYFSGYFNSYIDCVFEAMSGFTTTGSTILSEVESLSHGMLFWRSFAHWIGGMGILVFVLGIMNKIDASDIQLMRAESPGPAPGKLVPRLKESSRILYAIYFSLTVIMIISLLITGMPVFDSIIHSMGTAGTGGFSNRNISVGAYSNLAAEIVITVFTIIFSINFTMYFFLLKKNLKSVWKNEELRLFLLIVVTATVLITINILPNYNGSVGESLRHASFQVATIISTTGFSSTDFDLWPWFSKIILLGLMVVGACAGSTGGGVKISRILILFKSAKRETKRLLHPRLVGNIKTEKRSVEEGVIRNILVFFFLYIIIAFLATLLVSLDGYDLSTTISAVLSALGNVGPALGDAGPMSNFGVFSPVSKVILTFCMLAGRLEIMPVLVALSPSMWKRKAK